MRSINILEFSEYGARVRWQTVRDFFPFTSDPADSVDHPVIDPQCGYLSERCPRESIHNSDTKVPERLKLNKFMKFCHTRRFRKQRSEQQRKIEALKKKGVYQPQLQGGYAKLRAQLPAMLAFAAILRNRLRVQ